MIVYRVIRRDGIGNGYINFPWGFCEKCRRDIGRYSIPDWIYCPWCGHKFKRKHKEITYDELMKSIRKA